MRSQEASFRSSSSDIPSAGGCFPVAMKSRTAFTITRRNSTMARSLAPNFSWERSAMAPMLSCMAMS